MDAYMGEVVFDLKYGMCIRDWKGRLENNVIKFTCFLPHGLPRGCSQLQKHSSVLSYPANLYLSFQFQPECPIFKEIFLDKPY